MAVTTGFAFDFLQDFTLGNADRGVDLVGLIDGGFAAVAERTKLPIPYHTNLQVFDSDVGLVGQSFNNKGVEPTVSQLDNGNLVFVTRSGGDLRFTITDLSGETVLRPTALNYPAQLISASDPDVAGLDGGTFVIVSQIKTINGDHNIAFSVRASNGAQISASSTSFSSADDRAPSVAKLADGGFAVAWHRIAGKTTEIWYSVHNPDGSFRKAATLLDTFGSVNRNASVTALDNGGFAIVYEDNGWDGNRDLTLARLDENGTFVGWSNISAGPAGTNEFLPYATTLSNGFIAVSASHDAFGFLNGYLTLADPDTGTAFPPTAVSLTSEGDDDQTAVAALDLGRLVVVSSAIDGTGEVEAYLVQTRRVSNGDGAHDTIKGDDLVDHMNGGGGNDKLLGGLNNDILSGESNDDTLNGGAGDDTLLGGANSDILFGSAGRDMMNGGSGADVFDFDKTGHSGTTAATRDAIFGFVHLQDRIDLQSIDAKPGTVGDQAFTFIGTSNFSAPGQVRAEQSGPHTLIEINTAGLSTAEMTIALANFTATTLTAADFDL